MELESPDLVTLDGSNPDEVKLCAGRCAACDFLFFPPHPYSCERCGAPASQIARIALPARGSVRATALIHRTSDGVPTAVASIQLDAGPVLRGVLMRSDPLPREGETVVGQLVEDPVVKRRRLRFAVAS